MHLKDARGQRGIGLLLVGLAFVIFLFVGGAVGNAFSAILLLAGFVIFARSFRKGSKKGLYCRLIMEKGPSEIVGPFKDKSEIIEWYNDREDWDGVKEVQTIA